MKPVRPTITHPTRASVVTSNPAEKSLAKPPVAAQGLRAFPGFWNQASGAASAAVAWLWHGYLAAGNVTLLTSQWKSGKTTLVAVLLARLARGGTLAGLTVAPGKAVMISEECGQE